MEKHSKERRNEYVKMGKKHYSDATECYTRAISQKVLSEAGNSALYLATKAALAMNLLAEAKSYCEKGLEHDPNNEELGKLLRQIDSRKL
ncbi:Tetratricopeptide repeat protein 4-like protein [Tripterygium wilfordii]|uniref:Tetratricopeptide repeat protein 4-like protein n=1 Tax=Tripterygium wilfordii TaxID=458696 RepID=A0A7J7CYQ1_TRIWF|nr:Tetratricopeptide repeat protein 4-like protein [Tripterygium wilfordii]